MSFGFFKKQQPQLIFTGGPGDSAAKAVVIRGAPNLLAVVQGEVQFLTERYGKRDEDWVLEDRMTTRVGNRLYHVVRVKARYNTNKIIYFDITECPHP